jgi:hypothetical protein
MTGIVRDGVFLVGAGLMAAGAYQLLPAPWLLLVGGGAITFVALRMRG